MIPKRTAGRYVLVIDQRISHMGYLKHNVYDERSREKICLINTSSKSTAPDDMVVEIRELAGVNA